MTRSAMGIAWKLTEGDQPDHIVMADPEGNEFCLV